MSVVKSYLVLIVSLAAVLLVTFTITMLLWNAFIPEMLGLPKINLIDTAIIYVVINLLRFNYLRTYINLADKQIQNIEAGLKKTKEDMRK